jgi:hypothetical protein
VTIFFFEFADKNKEKETIVGIRMVATGRGVFLISPGT